MSFAQTTVPPEIGPSVLEICWSYQVGCNPRNPDATTKAIWENIYTKLNLTNDVWCKAVGMNMLMRSYSAAQGGTRPFFLFDEEIEAVDPDGQVGILAGTAHHPEYSIPDGYPGEIGIYSRLSLGRMRNAMIHEAAHMAVRSADKPLSGLPSAYQIADRCQSLIGG